MKLLSNPIVIRMGVVFVIMCFAFWIATMLLRRMRRVLTEESFAIAAAPELERLPMHTYNAVIQQLKQQKHELLSLQQVERRRAKTSENISAAVLSNLSSGVLFLDAKGLVRTANAAAKSILGFASPVGLSVREIFREARFSSAWSRQALAEAARSSLRAASASRTAEADYVTPGGEPRILEFTISPVFTPSRRNVRRDGAGVGQFAGYDFELLAAVGSQARLEIGATVGGRHRLRGSGPGSQDWRISRGRKSREGRSSLSSINADGPAQIGRPRHGG